MKKLLALAAVFCFGVTVHAADVADLTQKLKDKDADVRRAAAQDLANMGADAKPAVAALTAALKDTDLFVRRFSAQALGGIGPDAKDAVPALAAVLKNSKEQKEAQEAAAVALGKIGAVSVNALIAAVKDRDMDASVRRSAVQGLSRIGPDAKAAIPTLTDELAVKDAGKGKKKMADPNSIKMDVVSALGEIATVKDDKALEALEALTTAKGAKKDKDLKTAVQDAVKKIKART